MERSSRRSAAAVASSSASGSAQSNSSSNGNGGAASSRRRRREAAAKASAASQSEDGETDSSSVAVETTTYRRSRAATKQQQQLLRQQRQRDKETPAASDAGEHDDDDHEDDNDSARANGGNKRERSLSTVSTTSSSSSFASEHNEEDREAKQTEKMQELEKKKQMVEDGTLAEYCRRVTEFKEERNRLLQSAEWHKSLQVKNAEDLYGFEVQRAHNLWQNAKEAFKEEMLKKLQAVRKKLEQEMAEISKPVVESVESEIAEKEPQAVVDPTKASDISVLIKDVEITASSTPVVQVHKRRKVEIEIPEQMETLSLDDITADLASIMGERSHTAVAAEATLTPSEPIKNVRRRLISGKYVFEDGDEVVVSLPILQEDYIGTISSVTESAVYVHLTSGQYVRIYLDLIMSRRCELKPFLRGTAAMDSLQTTGWVECEPF